MPAPGRLALTAACVACGAQALQIPLQWPFGGPAKIADLNAEYKSKPLVDTQELQSLVDVKNLKKRAEKLYELAKLSEPEFNHPTRVIGSKGHNGTLQYITDTLASLGSYYDVWTQDFPVVLSNVFEARLVIGDEVPKTATAMALSPATANRQPIFGQVLLAKNNGCHPSDYTSKIEGNIALIKRGGCSFGDKSIQAGKAGAAAAVIYNDEEGELNGSLGEPTSDHVATFALSHEEGAKYAKKLRNKEDLDGIAYIDAVVETIYTTNVLAQTAHGDDDNCILVGGHSDSVGDGPGINDDGSGSLSILEVAAQLTNFRVNNCVRFAWWAAEEEGLLGSIYYATHLSEKENQKIRVSFDYDMLASPNYALQVYNSTNDENPTGSEELRDLYVDWYKDNGLNYTFIPFDGRSDYVGFINAGIPSGGIATGAEGIKTEEEKDMFGGRVGHWYDPAYHQLADDVSNLNLTIWELNTKLVAHSIATYARSFKDFPERADSVRESSSGERFKYRGRQLIM